MTFETRNNKEKGDKTDSSKRALSSKTKIIMVKTKDMLRINSSVETISKQRMSTPYFGVLIEIAGNNTIMNTDALHDIIVKSARLKEENYKLKDQVRRLSTK